MTFAISRVGTMRGREMAAPVDGCYQNEKGQWSIGLQTLNDILRLSSKTGCDLRVFDDCGMPTIEICD